MFIKKGGNKPDPKIGKADGPGKVSSGVGSSGKTERAESQGRPSAMSDKMRSIPKLPEKGATLRLGGHIGSVLFFALFLIIIARFMGYSMNVATPFAVVASDSMKPTLDRGDIVLWTPVRVEDVKVGDVVIFLSTSSAHKGFTIIHRVIEVEQRSSGPAFMTQGDNNEFPDQSGPIQGVEQAVTESNLLGRALTVGGQPFRFPILGHLWLFVVENILSGPIAPAAVPFGMALASIFIAAATVTEKKETTRKERILELVMGPQRIKWVVVFLVLLGLFTLMIGWPVITGKREFQVSIGVQTAADAADISLSQVQMLVEINASLVIDNPGAIDVRGFAVMDGEASKFLRLDSQVVEIRANSNATINVIVLLPSDLARGVYNARITVYASPHWLILPTPVIHAAAAYWQDDTAYAVNFLIALMLTVLLLGSYFLVLRALEHLEPAFYRRHVEQTRKPSEVSMFLVGAWFSFSKRVRRVWLQASGWARGIHLVKVRLVEPAIAAVVTSPALILALNGQLLVAVLLAAPFAGLVSYVVWGARFRSQVMASGLASALLIVLFTVTFPLMSEELFARVEPLFWLSLLTQTIGIGLIIYALVAIPVAYLAYIVPTALHNYRERIDPSVRVREFSDF